MWRRLGGFVGLSAFSLLTPLVLLPVIARQETIEVWAGYLLGQSIGTFGALFINSGWNLQGPGLIAPLSEDERRPYLPASNRQRGRTLLIVAPLASAITWLLCDPAGRLPAVLMTVAFCLVGVSPVWYAIGVGRPSLIARYDAGPRLIAVMVSLLALLGGAAATIYPLALIVAGLFGPAMLHRHIVRSSGTRPSPGRFWRSTFIDVAAGAYSASLLGLVGFAGGPAVLGRFGPGERLFRAGTVGLTAVTNALQGWVTEVEGREAARRLSRSLAAHAAIGAVGLFALVAFAPAVTAALFGEAFRISTSTAMGLGAAYLILCLGSCFGRHALIPRGRAEVALHSTIAGGAIGVPLILALVHVHGVPGAAWGLAVSEFVVAAWQAPAVLRVLRTLRR